MGRNLVPVHQTQRSTPPSVLLTVGAICEINLKRFVSRPLQAGGSVIASFVTETADEIGKLLRKRKLAQRDIPKR
jgi:hypothetical protein